MIKRKIILFGPWAPPYGGVAIHMKDLYENLKLLNFPVKVLGWGNFTPQRDIERIYLSRRKWFLTLFKIFRYTRSGDIIHKHSVLTSYPDKCLIRTFLWLVRIKRLKWVETIHDETLIHRFAAFPNAIKKEFPVYLSKADRIIAIGERLKAFLINIGVLEEKVEVSNPLLPIRFTSNKLELPHTLRTFFNSHSPVITTIGPLHPWYDFKTIVQAFLLLKHEYPQAGLVIVNMLFARDREYEEEVRALIKKLPRDVSIIFELERKALLSMLRDSNLFIRGSGQDSFGISKVEAILMGTPVVATNTGETRYMMLYDYGNPKDLYDKIRRVLSGEFKIDLEEAKRLFQDMADENFRKITDIYRTV